MSEIISKKQAKYLGLKRFFTGIACKESHIAERYTSSGQCIECEKIRLRKRSINGYKSPNYQKRIDARRYSGHYKTEDYKQKAAERRKILRECPIQKEKQKEYSKRYREKYPEKIRKASLERRSTPERAACEREKDRIYLQKNKDRINPIKNAAMRNRRKNSVNARLACNMRAAFKRIFKMAAIGKDRKTFETLGYTAEQLKSHIERQFNKNMAWENYADYWEIDHIIPVSHFFKIGEHDPKKINCLTNLRPLECSKNRSKNAKIEFLI